jgi:hypothetical protein
VPRKTGKIKSQKTILIIVEGYTEKIYFSQMKSVERIQGVTIIPRLAKHSSLISILDTAIKEYKENVYDSIWCVFDRDTLLSNTVSNELKVKFEQALSLGIKFADSLPAFEIWFLLHFELPKKYYKNQEALIRELKYHIQDYDKNSDWFIKTNLYIMLRNLLDIAKSNSKILEKRNLESFDSNASMCNVYRIFDEVIVSKR